MERKPKNVIIALGLLITIAVLGYFVFKNGVVARESQSVFRLKMGKENFFQKDIGNVIDRTREVVGLPEKLYIQNDMTIFFDRSGYITALDAILCGKDKEGRIKTYVLAYNMEKSDNMTVTVERAEKAVVTDYRLLDPLFVTLSKMDMKKIISGWNEDRFGILYRGFRSFGYDPSGIVYVDRDGKTKKATNASREIQGYFVSVYVPDKEQQYRPFRYELVDNLEEIPAEKNSDVTIMTEGNGSDDTQGMKKHTEYYVNPKVGYIVDEVGQTAGQTNYCLITTKDGGKTWGKCNDDPFHGKSGTDPSVFFVNEKLGFLVLRSVSQRYAGLYRTEDGGTTFEEIMIKSEEEGEAFDYPEPPYEEDGMLKLKVTKGADVDNPYDDPAVIYASKDKGKTWSAYQTANQLDNN